MKPSEPCPNFTGGRSVLATLDALRPDQKGGFRGRTYTKVHGINGIGPIPGGLLRYEGRDRNGHALVVRDRAGKAVNLLTLNPRFPQDLQQELLPLAPIGGTYVYMPAWRPAATTQSLIVTADWYTAYLLGRATGYPALACLFMENIPQVLSAWSSASSRQSIWVCFDGHAGDVDNQELIALNSLFDDVSARLVLIPSGEGKTFRRIHEQHGYRGLRKAVLEARKAESRPFPKAEEYPELGVNYLPVPWPSPVAGRFLLKHLRQTLESFISLAPGASLLIALWIIKTYASTCFRFNPLLALSSPEPGCGKSTLEYLLQFLCRRAHGVESIGSADLRTLLAARPLNSAKNLRPTDYETLILDEAQDIFNDRKVVAALRTSYDRLSLGVTTTKKFKMATQSMQGSVVLAYRASSMPETLASRSIHIQLQRVGADEELQRQETLLDESVQREFVGTRAMVRRWADDNSLALAQIEAPSLGLKNPRANDVFAPLLAIAAAIGSDVVEEAKAAAASSLAGGVATSPGLQLLWDIRYALLDWNDELISTADLLAKLKATPNSSWDHLNSANLWRILAPYGLSTTDVRTDSGVVKRYRTSLVKDAVGKYLPDPELGGRGAVRSVKDI